MTLLARSSIKSAEDRKMKKYYWYRRISCTIQRGNSIAISKRIIDIVQTTTPLQDEYYSDNIIDLEHNNIDTMLRSSSVV